MNNFNEKVVENLQHEVECLNHSLAKAREDKNFSMYKNLINSYRETVMLINELKKDKIVVNLKDINNEVEIKETEMYIFKEEHILNDGVITLNEMPLKDSCVLINFSNTNEEVHIANINDKKEIVVPEKYKNYKGKVYCTYRRKVLAECMKISGDDLVKAATERINNIIIKDEGTVADKVTMDKDLRVNNHMIKNTIEKEIKEGIEKIDCYRGRGFISVEAKKFMAKYDVVIKAGFDIDVPVFENRIRDIISNMLLKNFVDTVKLVQHIGDNKLNNIVFSNK